MGIARYHGVWDVTLCLQALQDCLALNTKATRFFEKPGAAHLRAEAHIPIELSPQSSSVILSLSMMS